MKKIKILIVSLFLCLSAAGMGWCYSITDAGPYLNSEVGGLDSLIATISKSNLDALPLTGNNWEQETAWVNSALSLESVTFYAKDDPVTYYNTDGPDVYAFPITTPPASEYFLLKNAQWYALLRNNAEMGWGVFSPPLLPAGMNLNDYVISHVDRFDGTQVAPVPEPATILMLATGMAGLLLSSRKKFKL